MHLQTACKEIFTQLLDLTYQLSLEAYAMPLPVLSGNTLGKHLRHIVEFYDILLRDYPSGHLNYDARTHDRSLETDIQLAIGKLQELSEAIYEIPTHTHLLLSASFSKETSEEVQVESTIGRELLYNLEHAIHHMAIMAIAIRQHFPEIHIPENFGIAYSTLRYQTQPVSCE